MRARLFRPLIGAVLIIWTGTQTSAAVLTGSVLRASAEDAASNQTDAARMREIAARFAPIFYQALGTQKRNDYLTNFDFDGDWRGDNNWANAENRRFHLRAYVYYAVSETPTHFFIHYAVFHPRDYKGGGLSGKLLSAAIREGARRGGRYDPTGLAREVALSHENDMEGCLVVVAKGGGGLASATVAFVETLAHNRFLKYAPDDHPLDGYKRVRLEDQRPELYIEPKGHGIKSFEASDKSSSRRAVLVYRFTGSADDPETQDRGGAVGYELLSLYDTLWPRAHDGINETYGATYDYATISVNVVQKSGKTISQQVNLGTLGAAFSGKVGAENMARPPWGWFDIDERDERTGLWFFDPASVIKRHFNLVGNFSTAYLDAPFLGVFRP
jgi:hypothetical protein